MGLGDLVMVFEKYGLKGALVIILLLFIYTLLKSNWFSGVLTKLSDSFVERFMRKKTKDYVRLITESDIINHDIFNYIDFWVFSKVPTIQFSSDYRTAVFRKYITIYLKSHKRKIQEFVLNKEYQSMDSPKVWKALNDLINQIVYDYEMELINAGIPKIVIDKMKVKNTDIITLKFDLIEGICNSQFYESDNNFLKVYSILNIFLSILENTISNSEPVCNSINGALKGLKFEGYTEP